MHIHRTDLPSYINRLATPALWFVVAFYTIATYGRVGESREECIQRYGYPVDGIDNGLIFEKDGIRLECIFEGNTCVFIMYNRHPSGLTSAEIAALLKANSDESHEWTQLSSWLWWRSDAVVAIGKDKGLLICRSKYYKGTNETSTLPGF